MFRVRWSDGVLIAEYPDIAGAEARRIKIQTACLTDSGVDREYVYIELPPSVDTVSRRRIYLDANSSNDYCIEDIATGLSNICRFAGQIPVHYSVAQHCVYAAWQLRHHGPAGALGALLHDATEAYLGDVPRPVKSLCPEYKAIEKWMLPEIMQQHGALYDDAAVHEIDNRLLVTEARSFGLGEWTFAEPYPAILMPWPQVRAKEEFLKLYTKLKKAC